MNHSEFSHMAGTVDDRTINIVVVINYYYYLYLFAVKFYYADLPVFSTVNFFYVYFCYKIKNNSLSK